LDAATALALVNDELARNGMPPTFMTEEHSQEAFATLQQYASASGRPLDVAIKDLVRFQMQTIHLEQLRRQS
jgi:hypothetical protein